MLTLRKQAYKFAHIPYTTFATKIYILFIKRRGWDRVLLAEVLLARTELRVWFLAPQKSCAAMQACNPSTQTGGGGGGGLPSPAEQV